MYVLRVLARSAAALMIVSSGGAYAATMNCASLKPAMERSQIPDLAIAVFKGGKVKSIFCSSSAHLVSSDSVLKLLLLASQSSP